MLYVPMFKGRGCEHQVMERTNKYFSGNIIPLIEILRDHYHPTGFATNPVTGEFLKRKAGSRIQKYRVEPKDDDRNTLEYYNTLIDGKKAFIDFFRFSIDVYGRKINPSAVDLSQRLNQSESLYIERLFEVGNYANFIPVLSLKKGFFPETYNALDLLKELQRSNSQIAIRMDDAALETFGPKVASVLRNEDFAMYDIGEQNVASKVMEINSFNETKTLGRKIILNSPRKRAIQNSEYENAQHTCLINNSARDINAEFPNIYGFGDYCGVKDVLPNNAIITRGAALALFYQYSINKFMVYVNTNTAEAVRGYLHLMPQILRDSYLLDPQNDCPAIEWVRMQANKNKTGKWGDWTSLNMIRYITQIAKNI